MNHGMKDRPRHRANEPVAIPVQTKNADNNAGSQCILNATFPFR